jgi:hypothetical protein
MDMDKVQLRANWLRSIVLAVVLIWIVNFSTYFFIGLHLGGYAYLGKAEAGRYFLVSHGAYTVVGRETYLYSEWHGLAVLVNFLVMGLLLLAVVVTRAVRRDRI